jgi:hypothetical protein
MMQLHHTPLPRVVVLLGRAGLAARGIVYVTIGTLALMAALGVGGGKVVDQRGAIGEIGDSTFGPILLCGVAIGLAAYVLWRGTQVIFGPRGDRSTKKQISKRAVALFSGVAYSGIAATALRAALGQRSSSSRGGAAQREGAEFALSQPLGQWIVAAIAAAVILAALVQFRRALTAKFSERLDDHELSAERSRLARNAGRAGYAARGVAFSLIGWFFLQAALHDNPRKTGGLAEVLQTLASQPSGPILMGVVGAGLALFGVYSLVEARYRRID